MEDVWSSTPALDSGIIRRCVGAALDNDDVGAEDKMDERMEESAEGRPTRGEAAKTPEEKMREQLLAQKAAEESDFNLMNDMQINLQHLQKHRCRFFL